ncbi:MAG: hypothetical protein ABIJ05_02740 [Patescibacteria group bacterium]
MNINTNLNTDKDPLLLTTLEIVFNRIFGILLIIASIPFFINIFTLPTIILYIIFGIYLFFSKKYRLFASIVFFIFALGIYFIPLPIGWGWFSVLKELRLNAFRFNIPPFFLVAPIIYISFSVKNLLGNIYVYFKTGIVSRNVFYLTSLFIILVILLTYPFLDKVRLRPQSLSGQGGRDLSLIVIRQSLTFIDQYHKEDGFTARFDSSSKKYIYRLRLIKPLEKDLQFTKVETDGEKINFTTDSRVACLGCQKNMNTPNSLIFPAGKDIDFIITSDQLIRVINFTESDNKANEFVFWK